MFYDISLVITGLAVRLKVCVKSAMYNERYSFYLNKKLSIRNEQGKGKVKAIPVHAWTGPYGPRRLRPPEFLDNRHMKVARWSNLHIGRLYPPLPGDTPDTNFCNRLSRIQGHSAAGRIKSIIPLGIKLANFRLVAQCLKQPLPQRPLPPLPNTKDTSSFQFAVNFKNYKCSGY